LNIAAFPAAGLIDRVSGRKLQSTQRRRFYTVDKSGRFYEDIEAEKQAEGMAIDMLLSDLGYDGDTSEQFPTLSSYQMELFLKRRRFSQIDADVDPLAATMFNLTKMLHHSKDGLRTIAKLNQATG
jgi:hypothetical protein